MQRNTQTDHGKLILGLRSDPLPFSKIVSLLNFPKEIFLFNRFDFFTPIDPY